MGVAVKGLNDQELMEQEKEAHVAEIEAQKAEAKLEALEHEQNETTEVEVINEKKSEEE